MIIDYGQSYTIASPPTDYCTKSNYVAPEMGFEGRIGLEADIWALGCAIFEIRAGRPLFDPLFGSDVDILMQTVQILGRLPDPWWSTFEDWALWFESFEGYGEPRSVGARERGGLVKEASKSSIGKELRSIGRHDVPSFYDEGPMVEKSGVGLDKEEVKLLDDLLRKMLRYRPEERIGMQEVIEHPWFEL
jgi:serine/threonine protein kinase